MFILNENFETKIDNFTNRHEGEVKVLYQHQISHIDIFINEHLLCILKHEQCTHCMFVRLSI